MIITVNGKEISTSELTYSEMNFGILSAGENFKIELTLTEATNFLSESYSQLMEDFKADEQFRTKGQDPLYDRMVELGFPNFAKSLEVAPEFIEFYIKFNPADIYGALPAIFPRTKNFLYVINTIRSVQIQKDFLIIEGLVFVPSQSAKQL